MKIIKFKVKKENDELIFLKKISKTQINYDFFDSDTTFIILQFTNIFSFVFNLKLQKKGMHFCSISMSLYT
jgi:hypothetical protein